MIFKYTAVILATSLLAFSFVQAETPALKKDLKVEPLKDKIPPKKLNEYPGVEWQPSPETRDKYPGVEWRPSVDATAANVPKKDLAIKDVPKIAKPLTKAIILKPSMQLMAQASIDMRDVLNSWKILRKYYKQSYKAVYFANVDNGRPAHATPPRAWVNPYANIFSGSSTNNDEYIPPKNIFEVIQRARKEAAVCTNRAYSVADQTAAGCVADETVAKCQKKLVNYCTNKIFTDLEVDDLVKTTVKELKKLSKESKILADKLSLSTR